MSPPTERCATQSCVASLSGLSGANSASVFRLSPETEGHRLGPTTSWGMQLSTDSLFNGFALSVTERSNVSAAALPARGDGTQTWATPRHIIDAVDLPFALDACAQPATAKVGRFYALERGENGLHDPWLDATWCNPPYEEQARWLARGAYLAETEGIRSAHLVLASTSSLYWRPMTFERGTVDFYEGRIAFLDARGRPVRGASFASALVQFGPGSTVGVVRTRSAETGRIVGTSRQWRLL